MNKRIFNLRMLRRIGQPSHSYPHTIAVAARENNPGAFKIQRWGWTRFVVAINHRQRATKPNSPSRNGKFRPPPGRRSELYSPPK